MKLLRESKTMDEWAEKYTMVGDKGDIIAKYASNDIVFPDANVRKIPFHAIVEDLIKLGYHLFDDDLKEWETNIEEPWFMDHKLKELELPKPAHANLLHIGWMLMVPEDSGFYCACQKPEKFNIILKSEVPFLCPLCNKKRERWFGIDSYLEDWLIKDGFSLDSEYMKKWIIDLMQYDEKFVKESFVEFLDKTHFDPDKIPYDYNATRVSLSGEDPKSIIKLFEKDIQESKNPVQDR